MNKILLLPIELSEIQIWLIRYFEVRVQTFFGTPLLWVRFLWNFLKCCKLIVFKFHKCILIMTSFLTFFKCLQRDRILIMYKEKQLWRREITQPSLLGIVGPWSLMLFRRQNCFVKVSTDWHLACFNVKIFKVSVFVMLILTLWTQKTDTVKPVLCDHCQERPPGS